MQIDQIQIDLMQMGHMWRNHKQMGHCNTV